MVSGLTDCSRFKLEERAMIGLIEAKRNTVCRDKICKQHFTWKASAMKESGWSMPVRLFYIA